MKKLIINELYIYSLKEKKAYHTSFKDGINFVTSCKKDGNKRGKSVIMKSIYSTLGADCKFDSKWNFNDKTTILDVNIDEKKYFFIRSHNYFRIVDSSYNTIFETTRRDELSVKLKELFDFYIELPNRENILVLTPPAYMYLLNYVDQTGLSCTEFDSFSNLSQFPNYKKYALLSHFGIFNEEYYGLDKKLKNEEEKLKSTILEKTSLTSLINKLDAELSGTDYSTDITSLNNEIEINKVEYSNIVKNLSSTKNKIMKLQNSKIEVENLLEELKHEISDNTNNFKKYDADSETCPYCKSHINPFEFSYNYYDKNDDYLYINQKLISKLDDLKHQIEVQEVQYKKFLNDMKNYDDKINSISSNINDVIKHKGYVEMRNKLSDDLYKCEQSEITIQLEIKNIKKLIKKYASLKSKIDEQYFEYMTESIDNLSLQEIKPNDVKKIESNFIVTGSTRPLSTIAWYLSLLKIKKKFNPDAIIFPIVFDSPNNAELDDNNIAQTFKHILDNIDSDAQVIISTIEFNPLEYKNYNISNVVELSNEKYHLLNEKNYNEYIDLYKKIMNI